MILAVPPSLLADVDHGGLLSAAWQAFDSVAGRDGPRHALGFSLGSGILLEALERLEPYPDGVIVMSAYSSARDAAVRMRLLDPRLRWLVPGAGSS